MKLTFAKVLARKYQEVVLYLTLCPRQQLLSSADKVRHPGGIEKNPAFKELNMAQ